MGPFACPGPTFSTPQAFVVDGYQAQVVQGGTTAPLFGLWVYADDDVWVSGHGGVLLHYHGSTVWHSYPQAMDLELRSLWSPGGADLWVAGGTETATPAGVVLRWNGVAFDEVLRTAHPYRAIWGTSASDVWVVSIDGIVTRWDGTRWTELPPTNAELHATWGLPGGDIWVGGTGRTLLQFVNGGWVTPPWLAQAALFFADDEINAFWGTSDADLIVAGGGGAYGGGADFAWQTVQGAGSGGGSEGPMQGLASRDGGDFWMVGAGGEIEHLSAPDPGSPDGGRLRTAWHFTGVQPGPCWWWLTSTEGDLLRMSP